MTIQKTVSPRTTIYRYRRGVVWAEYIILAVYCLQVLVPGVVLLTWFVAAEPDEKASFAEVFVPLLPLFVLFGIWLWSVVYRLAGIRIRLENGKLWYGRRWGSTVVPLEAIERIQFPSVRYAGGWLKIVSKSKTLRITVAVQDISRLLLELKTNMDELELHDRYDRHKCFNFYKTATYSDQSWERMTASIWKWMLVTIAIAIAVILLTRWTPMLIGQAVVYGVGCWLLVTTTWYLPEFVFIRRLAKLSDEEAFTCPARDLEFEKSVYRKTFAISALFGIALVWLSILLGWWL